MEGRTTSSARAFVSRKALSYVGIHVYIIVSKQKSPGISARALVLGVSPKSVRNYKYLG